MKILNKAEREAIARDVFARYPKSQKVAVCADGTAFITDNGDMAAKNHALKNRSGKELEISNFTRDGLAESKPTSQKAEDLIAAIKEAATIEEVEAIVAIENQGKKRKSVLEAADARLTELKA